jgi:amylosucrase
VKHIIARRKAVPHLAADAPVRIVDLGNTAVFAFLRQSDEGPLLGLFNFTENWTTVAASNLRSLGISAFQDVLGGGQVDHHEGLVAIAPYGRLWLV